MPLSLQQYLFDLDHTGERLLVTAMSCQGPEGWTRYGLAVFEPSGDGWQGISLLPPPPDQRYAVGWQALADDRFQVDWAGADDGSTSVAYRWTGTIFQPVRE